MLKYVICISILMFSGCGNAANEGASKGTTKASSSVDLTNNKQDRASYALGLQIAEAYSSQGFEFNPEALAMGLKDGMPGGAPKLNEDEIMAVMMELQTEMQAKFESTQKEAGGKNEMEGSDFLINNRKREGVIVTESGLQYEVITMGDGPKPKETDKVKVHYLGTLISGKTFDSSYDRGEPIVFGLNQVIPGWTEVVQLMPVGSKFRAFIPSHLAYGAQGAGRDIGPNATLIFEIELLGIEK